MKYELYAVEVPTGPDEFELERRYDENGPGSVLTWESRTGAQGHVDKLKEQVADGELDVRVVTLTCDDEDGLASALSPEQMLRELHESLSVHGGLAPSAPTPDIPDGVRDLRLALLDEEAAELREAMTAGDLVKIADALADIVCVVVGTAVPYGIPFDAVFREVHRSNMTKVNDPGLWKLVKGPGYEEPRIAEILFGTVS